MVLAQEASTVFWIVSGLLLGLPLAVEYLRATRRSHRSLRSILWLVACVSLAALYLQPQRSRQVEQSALLLTGGASPTTEDSLRKMVPNLKAMTSLEEVRRQPWKSIFVAGQGLEANDWHQLHTASLRFIPGEIPEGIIELNLKEASVGEDIEMKGRLILTDSLQLQLLTPEGSTKYLNLAASDPFFHFSEEAAAQGNWLYQLVGTRGSDTIFQEQLPVRTKDPMRQNALLLGSTPSFEANALKNFLSGQNFGLASRITLSQNITQTDFLNMDQTSLRRIDSVLLSQFRLLVIDEVAYQQLGRKERSTIQSAVTYGDLGVLIFAETPDALQTFGTAQTTKEGLSSTLVAGTRKYEMSTAPIKPVGDDWHTQQLNGQAIGAIADYGLGKVGFPMLIDTHLLKLRGAHDLYAELWTSFLQNILGYDFGSQIIDLPRWATVGHQTKIRITSPQPPKVTFDSLQLPVINRPIRTDWWSADCWPVSPGWKTIAINESKHAVFVHDTSSWKSKQTYEKQQTSRFAVDSYVSQDGITQFQRINPWFFWVIFLLSVGGLWLEQKFS